MIQTLDNASISLNPFQSSKVFPSSEIQPKEALEEKDMKIKKLLDDVVGSSVLTLGGLLKMGEITMLQKLGAKEKHVKNMGHNWNIMYKYEYLCVYIYKIIYKHISGIIKQNQGAAKKSSNHCKHQESQLRESL